MKELYDKYKKMIADLFWGGVTTLVNIITFGLCARMDLSTGLSNIIAWVLSVLTAYLSNRKWVFQSTARTLHEVAKEFISFVACRIGTGLLDQLIMVAGVDWLSPMFIPDDHAFVWSMGLKIASNIIVIVLNYILSKLLVFRSKK